MDLRRGGVLTLGVCSMSETPVKLTSAPVDFLLPWTGIKIFTHTSFNAKFRLEIVTRTGN